MKGRCADENHARTRKTRFLNDWLSSYLQLVLHSQAVRNRVCNCSGGEPVDPGALFALPSLLRYTATP